MFRFASFVALLAAKTANAEGSTPHWDELEASLSSKDAFQLSNLDDWIDQCVAPFADLTIPDPDYEVSNYQLFEQPSGLCMDAMICAYEGCKWPFQSSWKDYRTFDTSEYPYDDWKTSNGMNLPTAVVHPKHVGDISETIKFAIDHNIGISVKTSGHSYTGSSTKKDTILLNLSKLQKYAPEGSIVECLDTDKSVPAGAYQEACNLATARNKTAVVRVGGGEVWDEVLRAVSVDWNDNNDNKYHIVSGAAGTVSAAGGWLASGGLSGNNGMRMYGVGVDQVLHVEMVLPSGNHVRFGPTSWADDSNSMYPLTTEVSGYCNTGMLSDEDSWVWESCEEDINFEDLWYAVRGGGGGTYGVVSSIYYQLHEYSPMELVNVSTAYIGYEFTTKWVEFVMKFFFDPEQVGVTDMESNSCSSPAAGGLSGGLFVCFNGGGEVMKSAWKAYYGDEYSTVVNVDDFFIVDKNFTTWASYQVWNGYMNPNVPDGRAADGPAAAVTASFYSTSTHVGEFLMFPNEAIVKSMDVLGTLLIDCMLQGKCFGAMYIMGGMIPSADDGLNSLPEHRRHGGFLLSVFDPVFREEMSRVFYGVNEDEAVTGDTFPGSLCHNHASMTYPTPLKEDWTKSCNPEWSGEEKKEKCYSFQETAFGTEGLKRLERIHETLDPDHLFQCEDCVGYPGSDYFLEENESNSASTLGVPLASILTAVGMLFVF